jgi:hypothetical protein
MPPIEALNTQELLQQLRDLSAREQALRFSQLLSTYHALPDYPTEQRLLPPLLSEVRNWRDEIAIADASAVELSDTA